MQPSIFFIIFSLFHDALDEIHYVNGTVYFATLTAAIHCRKRSVVDSIAAVNFAWKVLEKHLQASHSFMMNVLI